MKRIEHILWKYDLVIKVALVILWALWAVQLFSPIKNSISKEIKYQKNRNARAEQETIAELYKLAEEMVEKAKIEGPSYSPQRYFEDLRKLEEKRYFSRVAFSFTTSTVPLQQILLENVRKGYYQMQEIGKEAETFRYWNEDLRSHREEFTQQVHGLGWQEVLNWLIIFYRRTIPLALLFYIVRMAERKGILATILAEKKKFVLATMLWPVYFFKYPYNVVREIRVEAELRRLKGLFRIFSPRERRLVREIANSNYCKQWLADFHQQHRGSFQRGLFLALLATFFLHLLIPSNLRASEKRIRSPGLAFCRSEIQQTEIQQNIGDDTGENNHQVEEMGLPPEFGTSEPPLLVMIMKFLKEIVQNRQSDAIERVPRTSLFGNLTRIIN